MASRHLRATLFPILLLLMATGAMAQSLSQGGSNAAPSAAQEEDAILKLTPEKLDAFARAVLAVNRVGEIWQPRIETAASRQQAIALSKQAREQMEAAVDREPGISLSEYAAIATAARKNAELAATLQERLRALGPDGG